MDTYEPRGYRRAKRINPLGLAALLLTAAAAIFLIYSGINLFLKYRRASLRASDIRLAVIALKVCLAVGIAALLSSVGALFLRGRKRGVAVVSCVLAFLLLAGSGAGLYGYGYLFGKLDYDAAFQALSNKELHMAQVGDDGELIRNDVPLPSAVDDRSDTPTPSAVDEEPAVLDTLPDETEIERFLLRDSNIPKEAFEKMFTGAPSGASYLHSGSEEIENYLLLGLDKVLSADSIIVLSVDRAHHKLKLISIARDTYALMPQWNRFAKLAYAHNWGGATQMLITLNRNFNLNLSGYISVNFDQIVSIIDYIGGVDVELSSYDASILGKPVGVCHMDGETALRYARNRSDNEINRTERQRKVLVSLLRSAEALPISSYPRVVRDCLGLCTTSLSEDKLLELCGEVAQNGYRIEQHALIDYMDYWGGIIPSSANYFYCVYDLNRASDVLYRLLYEDLYTSGYADWPTVPER